MSGATGGPVATGDGPAVMGGRGTRVQRLRARALTGATAVACRLPERPLLAAADPIGELWYRATPRRAALARANLGRVCAWLAAEGRGPARARRAASDPRALESLVRAAYRHLARHYVESLRATVLTEEHVRERLEVTTPETVAASFAEPRGVIYIGGHIGPVEILAWVGGHGHRPPVVGAMETVDDPELQAWIARTRSGTGIELVGLAQARRRLREAIAEGGAALLVVDRDISGGGTEATLFGHPAPLPTGAAILAVETGARVFWEAVVRIGDGRYRGWMREVPVPAEGRLRVRVEAFLEQTARLIEESVAQAPEQWWAVFHPIWPDIAAEADAAGDAGAGAGGDAGATEATAATAGGR
jgi:KDO2-lipid IV(A) lauroyltransferase